MCETVLQTLQGQWERGVLLGPGTHCHGGLCALTVRARRGGMWHTRALC